MSDVAWSNTPEQAHSAAHWNDDERPSRSDAAELAPMVRRVGDSLDEALRWSAQEPGEWHENEAPEARVSRLLALLADQVIYGGKVADETKVRHWGRELASLA